MDFLKEFLGKHWLKLLTVLPAIPIILLLNSLDSFSGIDSFLRFLVSSAIMLFYLLLMSIGACFAISKLKIGKIVVGVLTVILFFATTYGAVMASRVIGLIDIVTATPVERGYSLVSMADFDKEALNGYGRVGILTIVEEAKDKARTEFLEEQNFVPNPITTNFDTPIEMINALYASEIDAMVISSNFVQIFDELEGFESIEYETVVLATFDVVTVQEERPDMDPGEPFSVLILGLDARDAAELEVGQIDTFMLATFNLDDLSFTLVSIPRDSFVSLPCFNYQNDKLAHANSSGGIACAVSAVENLMDMEIPYYVMVNMTAVVDIVDALGGVTVDVPITTWEQDSRRRSDEQHRIYLEEGVHLLDGEQALALMRHRRNLLNDFERSQNTQLVLEAMIREMLGSLSNVNDAMNLLEIISLNMRTNMTVHEITSLAQYLVGFLSSVGMNNLMHEIHFINMAITGESADVAFPHAMNVVFPSELQIAEARRLMMINLGLEEPEFTFTFEFDAFASGRRIWIQPDYGQQLPWYATQTEQELYVPVTPYVPTPPWQPPAPVEPTPTPDPEPTPESESESDPEPPAGESEPEPPAQESELDPPAQEPELDPPAQESEPPASSDNE